MIIYFIHLHRTKKNTNDDFTLYQKLQVLYALLLLTLQQSST
jgi:hypothetical protein